MERLTFEGNFCDIAQCRELPCPYDGTCSQKQVWQRLKAYEDTGLTPKEAKRMSNILMDVGIDYNCSWEYVKNWLLNDRLRELAEADKTGRLVVLPCRVGDAVWLTRTWVSERLSQPEAAALAGAYICGHGVCTFVTAKYGFQQDKVGKDVFLTREEAQKALEARKDETS